MRFPAEEVPDDKRSAQSASLDLSQAIIDLLKAVLGIGDDDVLPEDVVTDILAKYSFLDATDIQKGMRLSAFLKPVPGAGGDSGGDDEFGGDDMDLGDLGGDDGGDTGDAGDAGGEMPELLASTNYGVEYTNNVNVKYDTNVPANVIAGATITVTGTNGNIKNYYINITRSLFI
jgi:hypothetical protein